MLNESWSKSSHSLSTSCVEVNYFKSSHSVTGDCVEVGWHKSSYSGDSNCVEVGYRKSSYSNYNSSCVEVADGCGEVHVRDSKDPGGPALGFSPAAWMEFLGTLRK